MINRAWSILSKGVSYGDPSYSRKVYREAYSNSNADGVRMLQAICPYTDDLLRAGRSNDILGLVLKSPFSARVLEWDPVNTYDKSSLSFPSTGSSVSVTAAPTDLRIFVFTDSDEFLAEGRGSVTLSCDVDGTGKTISSDFSDSAFSSTGGLSSYITIYPGIRIRMQSDFSSGSPYSFQVSYVSTPYSDWGSILETAVNCSPVWADKDLENTWREDPLWSNRLAAFAVSATELCRNAERS